MRRSCSDLKISGKWSRWSDRRKPQERSKSWHRGVELPPDNVFRKYFHRVFSEIFRVVPRECLLVLPCYQKGWHLLMRTISPFVRLLMCWISLGFLFRTFFPDLFPTDSYIVESPKKSGNPNFTEQSESLLVCFKTWCLHILNDFRKNHCTLKDITCTS